MDDCKKAVNGTIEQLGGLDVIISNAVSSADDAVRWITELTICSSGMDQNDRLCRFECYD